MFIRKKPNASGKISVQVIDKSSGRYKVIKSVGSSSDPVQIENLVVQAKQWMNRRTGQTSLDLFNEAKPVEQLLDNIQQIKIAGTRLLLGKIYDEIGFHQIPDELLRTLVISRVCFPVSKRKTTEYLSRYEFFDLDPQHIYRYMDRIYDTHKKRLQDISYRHTLEILDHNIHIVFYDVTTLYFEIDTDDDLRKSGFSKDGKHQHPQVVLGLLVSVDGYPLGYELFEGNHFEGHTLIPVLEAFKENYDLDDMVVVADSAMLSRQNIQQLEQAGYQYILGARIKNEPEPIRKKILALSLNDGQSRLITKDSATRIVISYSQKRALKDQYNRQQGLERLHKRIKSGKLTKDKLNKRGYNKFLNLEGDARLSIDEAKIAEDAKWDGLKGYQTNTRLTKKSVISNYKQLWKIEKAFRITKHDLKIRPFYHRLPRRIHAHVSIAFAAYKLYKELERQLKLKKSKLSPEKVIDIAKSIYAIVIKSPQTKQEVTKTLFLTEEQKEIADLFDL